MDWIADLVDADPLLGPLGVVFLVDDEHSPPSWLFSDEGLPRHFGSRELVPEAFRVPGLRVEVRPEAPQPFVSYLFMEDGDDPSCLATCGRQAPFEDERVFQFCGLRAAYPLDGSLLLGLRIYGPPDPAGIGETLPALAERMVEILTCLDVTHDVPATREEAEGRLAALLAANPELRGCGTRLAS